MADGIFLSSLVFCNVGIHRGSEEARIFRCPLCESADRLTRRDRCLMGCFRELEPSVMSDEKYTPPILWNTEISSIEELMLN